ncbi:MAG: hypothetical protein KDA65_10750 [Planctomycetaceae bacterium]|nr:hypothetical protein [Planctomycetaceae bacterium]
MGWISHFTDINRKYVASTVVRLILIHSLLLGLAGCDPTPGRESAPAPGEIPSPSASPNPGSPVRTNELQAEPVVPQPEPDPFEEQTEPEPVYRPADNRQIPDSELLNKLGIHVVESKHIRIYSDLPVEKIESLPPLVDQLIAVLQEYFGELPPDRDGKPFQLSGYVMEDVPLYEKSGLLPPKFAQLEHGRHQGAEFWIVVPDTDYYLRHLLFHEATHCYMMYMPHTSAPVWYLEGMAELFATHRLQNEDKVEFNVFPEESSAYEGFGRIELIKQDSEKTGLKTIEQVTNLESGGYHSNISYAWAWALCRFFDQHADYQGRFRHFSRQYLREEPFAELFNTEFEPLANQLNQEWLSFASELEYGMEYEQLRIDFTPGRMLAGSTEFTVDSNLGWQNSGWQLEQGKTYHLEATGLFELDETTRPWTSTADGISFDYYRGVPLGQLLGVIRPTEVENPEQNFCFAQFARFGKQLTFRAPYNGTLYLRINDRPDQLFNNQGELQIRLEEVAADSQ